MGGFQACLLLQWVSAHALLVFSASSVFCSIVLSTESKTSEAMQDKRRHTHTTLLEVCVPPASPAIQLDVFSLLFPGGRKYEPHPELVAPGLAGALVLKNRLNCVFRTLPTFCLHCIKWQQELCLARTAPLFCAY